MKANRIVLGGLALTIAVTISSCSTSKQIAYKDDMYNNRQANVDQPYQSPDYYYTDEQYTEQNNDYYADEYSDEE